MFLFVSKQFNFQHFFNGALMQTLPKESHAVFQPYLR